MISLPITGTVDPGFLAGLEALKRAQDAAGTSSEAAGRKAEASGPAWARAFDAIGTGAMHFNSIRAAISSAASTIGAFADEVTRLATEQGRLDDMSRQLGLNFDEAAEAAGRFADETEAMGVAGRFAAADIRLTQSELNAVMRVAGSASTMLGTTTAGAVEQLQEALVRGREGGLQRFGAGLAAVAGEGHTLQERLAALVVQAGHTAAATDTAADSVARFRDSMEDSQRVAASAFSTELARLGSVAQNARSASEGVADLNRNLAAAGQTMALAVAAISGGMGVIVGSVGATLGALGQVASFTIPGGMGGGLNRLAGDLRRASQGLAVDSANGLMAIGRADRDKYLKDMLSDEKIGLGAFNRGGAASILPMATDWVSDSLGYGKPFGYARTSGLESHPLLGNPTFDVLANTPESLRTLRAAIDPKYNATQTDMRNLRKVVPGQNLPVVKNILDYYQTRLPKERYQR